MIEYDQSRESKTDEIRNLNIEFKQEQQSPELFAQDTSQINNTQD